MLQLDPVQRFLGLGIGVHVGNQSCFSPRPSLLMGDPPVGRSLLSQDNASIRARHR